MKYTVFVERYAQKQILKLDKKFISILKNQSLHHQIFQEPLN